MHGICTNFLFHPRLKACLVKIRVIDQMCSEGILIDDAHELIRIHLVETQKFNFTHISILLTLKISGARLGRPVEAKGRNELD